jgi:hypothetical protein
VGGPCGVRPQRRAGSASATLPAPARTGAWRARKSVESKRRRCATTSPLTSATEDEDRRAARSARGSRRLRVPKHARIGRNLRQSDRSCWQGQRPISASDPGSGITQRMRGNASASRGYQHSARPRPRLAEAGDCRSRGRDGERGAAGQSAHAVPMQGAGRGWAWRRCYARPQHRGGNDRIWVKGAAGGAATECDSWRPAAGWSVDRHDRGVCADAV